MKFSTTTCMLAAALGATARPSGHGHAQIHRSLEKRLDFVINEKPAAPVAVKPAAAAAVAPAPAPMKNAAYQAPSPHPQAASLPDASTPSAPQSKPNPSPVSGSSGPKKFCGGNTKRATLAQIAYKGNVGASGNFGCNLMMAEDISGYDYSATFENNSGQAQKCVVWLKIGPDGQVNGFQKGNEVLTFDLPVNGKKYLVAEANSQGSVACSPNQVQLNKYGQYSATWLEFDFANQSNNNWSGADASCLVAADSGQPIQAMSVCAKGQTCSVIKTGGTGTNAYLAGMQNLDGVGLNMTPGPVHLEVTIG
ncbi:hypothetical protein E4U55_000417 [Claviceps digitariae]|nr:hypothetical protein E4U55_000417 [Claviceps digitariae]